MKKTEQSVIKIPRTLAKSPVIGHSTRQAYVRNALRQKTFNSDLNFNSHTYFMTYLDCMNHLTEKKLGLEQQHLNGPFDSGFSLTENLFSLETTNM